MVINLTARPRINPYAAVFFGVIAVSISSILIKLSSAPALAIAAYRMLFTFLILAPVTLATSSGELRKVTREDLLLSVASGLFLALHFLSWITSLKYTSVASSVVLVTMQPVFVVIGGYFFLRESIPRSAFYGALAAMAGSIFIGLNDAQAGQDSLFGDLLAFAGAVLVAAYVVLGRGLRQRLSLLPYTFLVYGTASVVLLAASFLTGTPLWPYSAFNFALFLALAIFPTILGHTVFNWALRYVKAAVVSVSILGEPVGAVILAIPILKEIPGPAQLLGGAITLAGMYWFVRASAARAPEVGSTDTQPGNFEGKKGDGHLPAKL
ncbi:MAG: DMT family transporter [Syntrophothermus sp.]